MNYNKGPMRSAPEHPQGGTRQARRGASPHRHVRQALRTPPSLIRDEDRGMLAHTPAAHARTRGAVGVVIVDWRVSQGTYSKSGRSRPG